MPSSSASFSESADGVQQHFDFRALKSVFSDEVLVVPALYAYIVKHLEKTDEKIVYNPAAKLDFVYHKRQKGKALTNEDQAEFIAAIQGDYMRPLWLFYLLSGVRCQEALTLLWTDIDEKRGRIFIRGTKTENAERYIPLFPQIAELLKEVHRTGERVFPYTYRAVQCSFYRIRAASGLKFRIHDLRHPYVKHTTKKYNSEKQKTQTTNLSADSLGFLFLLFILRLCP